LLVDLSWLNLTCGLTAWLEELSGDHNSTVSDAYTDKLNKKFPVMQKFSCGNIFWPTPTRLL